MRKPLSQTSVQKVEHPQQAKKTVAILKNLWYVFVLRKDGEHI